MKIFPIRTCYTNNYNNLNTTKNSRKNNYANYQNINMGNSISFKGIQSKYNLMNSGFKTCIIKNDLLNATSKKIIIDSADKLVALSNSPEQWNKKIVLSDDIDLTNIKNFKSIGTKETPFTGEFDGNGCKITGLNIDTPDSNNCGFFGVCKSAKLKNFNIQGAKIVGKLQSGILVGNATECEIENCKITNSKINGLSKVGGLIGLCEDSNIKNAFVSAKITASKQTAGGIIGYDDSSNIETTYADSVIEAPSEVGGFIGYSNYSKINNSYSSSNGAEVEKSGAMIGWGDNSQIRNSYPADIGYNNNCDVEKIYEILPNNTLGFNVDRNLWDVNQKGIFTYPLRLKSVIKQEKPEKIFIDDLNFNIKMGLFDVVSDDYSTFAPPEHYPENDEMIKTAQNSKNTNELQNLFGDLVLHSYSNFEYKKYDEVLLEIIKNPAFKPNKTYNNPINDNFSCTPIFILTTLNRPYLLREALKRNDLGDIDKMNGWFETGKKTMMDRAIDHNLLDCVYVMLKSENQHFDIEKYSNKAKLASPEMYELFQMYPDIPDYELYETQNRKIEYVENLKDVLTTVGIPDNFEDTQGNSIFNIAALLDDERAGLEIALNAIYRGFDIEHKNKNGDTALKIALDNKKNILACNLLKYGADKDTVNSEGENAILVFSKIDDQNVANNFIEFCTQKGMTLNSQDYEGNTPLINAINQQSYEVIENLIQIGACINFPNHEGETPLHFACSNQDKKSMEILLENFANIFAKNSAGKTPKDYLTNPDLIREYEQYEKLYEQNNIELDDIFYSSKISQNDNTLIDKETFLKINNSNSKIAEQMTYNAIKALRENNIQTSEIIDDEDNNLLHLACQNKTNFAKELIKIALDCGFDINEKNANGKTPLMLAIDTYLDCNDTKEKFTVLSNIKYLLENRPNIEIIDDNEQSALHSACKTDNSIILNLLLTQDPKINKKDINGKTPMNYINSDIVKLAIETYIKKISEGQ